MAVAHRAIASSFLLAMTVQPCVLSSLAAAYGASSRMKVALPSQPPTSSRWRRSATTRPQRTFIAGGTTEQSHGWQKHRTGLAWPFGREALSVAGGALALVGLVFLRTDRMTPAHPDFALPMDHHKYIRMASVGVLDFHIAPYAWRIGTPLLARSLPLDLGASFLLLTLAGLWATGVLVYLVGRQFGFSRSLAFLGMLLFYALGWAAKFVMYDFWLPDALACALLTLAVYLAARRQALALAVVLVLGALVKESIIFAYPLYYTLNTGRWLDKRLLARAVLVVLPSLAVLLTIRRVIPAWNDDPSYLATLPLTLRLVRQWDGTGGFYSSTFDYGWMLREVGLPQLGSLGLPGLVEWTLGTYGVAISLLACLDWRRNGRLLLRCLPMLAMVYAQALFVTVQPRTLVVAFPLLIVLALNGADAVLRRLDLPAVALYGLPLILLAMHLARTSGGFSEVLWIELPIAAAYALVLVALARSRKTLRRHSSES